jgi:hypothetical protein
MDNFLKPYMVGENPQVTETTFGGISFIDVKWNFDFVGGKPERLKVINHLKKNGYTNWHGLYITKIK